MARFLNIIAQYKIHGRDDDLLKLAWAECGSARM